MSKGQIFGPGAVCICWLRSPTHSIRLIETEVRPSEICSLRSENIRLNSPVSYLTIERPKALKLKRRLQIDVPLVSISLTATEKYPNGFTQYFGKETSLSAISMMVLKSWAPLPKSNHKIVFATALEKLWSFIKQKCPWRAYRLNLFIHYTQCN